jgi:hypothetical protein
LNNKLVRVWLQHPRRLLRIVFDQLGKQCPYLWFNFPDSTGFSFMVAHGASLATKRGTGNINPLNHVAFASEELGKRR